MNTFSATITITTVLFLVSGCRSEGDTIRKKYRQETEVLQQFCESETFHPRCWPDHVIAMHSAIYGRMRLGRCVEADLGYLGCSTNVLVMADSRCSGKQECEIRIPDGEFDRTKPCYKELKVYLEANYSCLRVAVDDQGCSIPALTSFLHLSPLIVNKNGCGSRSHPWILQSDPGQRINISLLDFFHVAWKEEPGTVGEGGSSSSKPCIQYGYILEPGSNRNVSICAGQDRHQFLYQSQSNVVEVVLGLTSRGLTQGPGKFNYLVRFQAVGCPDIRMLQDAWIRRSASEVVVGCNSTRQTWHLQCQGNQWTGVIGNCTQHLLAAQKEARIGLPSSQWKHDTLIIIVAGVSLTFCVLIVCSGLAFIKNGRSRSRTKRQINYDNVKTFEETRTVVDATQGGGGIGGSEDPWAAVPRLPAPLPPNSGRGGEGRDANKREVDGERLGTGGYTHVITTPDIPEVEYTDAMNSPDLSSSIWEKHGSFPVSGSGLDGCLMQLYGVETSSKPRASNSGFFNMDMSSHN